MRKYSRLTTYRRAMIGGLGLCLALCAGPARRVHADAKSPSGRTGAGLSDEQRGRLAALKAQALGRDFDKTLDAMRQMVAMGPAVRSELLGLLGTLLERNGAAVKAAARAVGPIQRIKPTEEKLRQLRAEALANIAKLQKHDQSIPKARAYYPVLLAGTKRLSRTLAARSRLVDLVAQRLTLLRIRGRAGGAGQELTPSADGRPSAIERAGQALGVSLRGARRLDALERLPGLKELFLYRLNRRIAAHNKALWRTMHGEEVRNVQAVNDYREALGLLRLEIDLRLLQSARRHSKEMVDLGYFSHDSPTEGHKGFGARAKQAGYPKPAGENIATGTRLHGGEASFQQWFGSPPHHRNMVHASYTAIGVGKWDGLWTQNFGRGERLMGADEAARRAAAPKGPILPPQR